MRYEDYTVGWICALPVEASAAICMLEERHNSLPQQSYDSNYYTLGRIGAHNVVIACLPAGVTGTNSAAAVATQTRSTFTSLRFGLMVGIGGGVPSANNDIRLGDIVISKPTATSGGVIQYDFGKTIQQQRFQRTGSLNRPPDILLSAVGSLQARHMMGEIELSTHLSELRSKYPTLQSRYPGLERDQLFASDYDHPLGSDTCVKCDKGRLVPRSDRDDELPIAHYGLIASGNQVMRDGNTREKLRKELDVLCFEMEAAGLMDNFPCLVIRGVCDYADSHKNREWQPYAAATAAAYAKELLCSMPGHRIAGMQTATATLTNTVKPIFSVPYSKDKHFVERKEIFSKIKGQLQINHRASICGIGGVGKSQVAIAYAYEFRQLQPESHVFWVYAASSARFVQAYEDIARRLKLPGWDQSNTDLCRAVSDWLDEEDSHWLLILDNADDESLFCPPIGSDIAPETTPQSRRPLSDYLPKILDSQKSIMITTRSRHLGMNLADGESCIEVKPFVTQEAEDLLRSKLDGVAGSHDKTATEQLLGTLGCMPLAITQAAAFIKRNQMTIQDYLAALENDQSLKDFLSTDLQDPRRQFGFPNSVFRTWELSFKQLLKQDPVAAKLLSLIAMLDPQKIPQKLLRCSVVKDLDFWTSIGTIHGFALITTELEGESYTIHPLVRASVHYWLEQRGEKRDYTRQALQLLAKEFPNGEYENKATCEMLLAHAQAILGYEYTSQDDLKHRAELISNFGWYNRSQARYSSAYREISEAYDINQKVRGNLAIPTLHDLSSLAVVLNDLGWYEKAEEMNRQALDGFEEVLGVEHPDTLSVVSNLASDLQRQGKYKMAEEMDRRVLIEREKLLGAEHPSTLFSMSNLASDLRKQGKYEMAKEVDRRVLIERETLLGADHLDTLSSMSNLAVDLRKQGKYKAAEEMNRRALSGLERALGAEHPEILRTLAHLALIFRDQGKYTIAEEMSRRALNGREKVLGAEHPDTLRSVFHLAYLSHIQKLYNDASVLYLRASEGYSRVLGPDHPTTQKCSKFYARMIQEMEDQGRKSTALSSTSERQEGVPRRSARIIQKRRRASRSKRK